MGGVQPHHLRPQLLGQAQIVLDAEARIVAQ